MSLVWVVFVFCRFYFDLGFVEVAYFLFGLPIFDLLLLVKGAVYLGFCDCLHAICFVCCFVVDLGRIFSVLVATWG